MRKEMNIPIICFFSLIYLFGCAQSHTFKEVYPKETVWIPESKEFKRSIYDSSLVLVFQKYFSDTIRISIDGKELSKSFYKTDKSTLVVHDFFKIEGVNYNSDKAILIELLGKKEQLKIEMRVNFKYAYLTRDEDGNWFVEYSIYRRKYY